MTCRRIESRRAALAGVIVILGLGVIHVPLRADEDGRTAMPFLQQLKQRGLHDLALEYLGQLRTDPSLPESTKALLDYEEGRTLVDEASRSNDLVLRQQLLEEARDKLAAFIKGHGQLEAARDALVQMSRLLVERGHLAMLLSADASDPSKKAEKLVEARACFTEAHDAYAKAIEPLSAAHKKYVGFISDNDPRRAERDALYASLLDAMLQKGMCDYELAQTYPAGSKERAQILDGAAKQFDGLYKNYRTQLVGLTAQMMMAKCYEEQGNIGPAIGIYKTLMEHTDPRLRKLQRNVGYFYIVALGKRKEYALAADQAARWLETYSLRDERLLPERLGVFFERAKDLDAQWPEFSSAQRPGQARQIIDALSQVVRYASPYKNEAVALLRKYKPSAAVKAEELSRLTYQDAMERADEAMAAHEWDRAIALLKAGVRRADPARDVTSANRARYNLAFCYYMTKQFYEADVLAEHLARRYPQGGLSAQATDIGMQALADAYNAYTDIDRKSDLERLIDLAKYTAETWPNREQGDDARINLGLIYNGRGQYDLALEALGKVRPRSRRWVEAQTRIGGAHWAKSRLLQRSGNASGAQVEAQRALDVLNACLKTRRDSGAGPTDPGLVGNVGDLAIVLTETGKPAQALALLEPVAQAQTAKTGPAYARLMEAALTAYITSGQVERAIASMKALEQAGGATARAPLYFRLGTLLQKELDGLRARKDTAALTRMYQTFKAFLTTLAESKTGQSFESLEWAGESLLAIDASSEAEKVLRRVLSEFSQDPQFLQQRNGPARLMRTRVKLAAALRGQSKFDDAATLIDELIDKNRGYIDPLFEKGMLLEARAQAERKADQWSAALAYWEELAKRVERMRPRAPIYYDIWYHVAATLSKQKDKVRARQTLGAVMRLAPGVGSPEMKAKYLDLLAQLK